MFARFDHDVVLFGLSFIAQAQRDKRKLETAEAAPLQRETEPQQVEHAQQEHLRDRDQVRGWVPYELPPRWPWQTPLWRPPMGVSFEI
jgi:hypothetical protein